MTLKTSLLFMLAVLLGGCARAESAQPSALTPATFASQTAAEQYAKKLVAGGAVERLRVGTQDILVLYVYGSGVPDRAIAAYRFTDGQWDRAAELEPNSAGIHRARVRDGAIVVVSDRSTAKVVLLPAAEKPTAPAAQPR